MDFHPSSTQLDPQIGTPGGSIAQGVANVSTVDGMGGGLLLAGLLTAVVCVAAGWSSSLGTDESAPILRECDR